MSSVLHPVGPEGEERYWVRRVAVLVAAIVAIVVVIALVSSAMSAGSAVQAEPAPPTSVPPAVSTTAVPTASPSDAGTASASPTPGATDAGATPAAGSTPTGTSTPSASTDSKKSDDKSADDTKSAKKTTKKSTKQPVYATCDGDDLRPKMTGDQTVKVKHKTTLDLSLVNTGKKTCKVTVNPDKVVLTVVSGSDRIWSTKDCPAAMPSRKRTLLPDHALSWKVEWSGKRSGKGCSMEKVAPKKGYYWAIASVDGSDDVRFRLILV